MSDLSESITYILDKQTSPVTYSYICTVLPKWTFGEITHAVDKLKEKGVVQVGSEGISKTNSVIIRKPIDMDSATDDKTAPWGVAPQNGSKRITPVNNKKRKQSEKDGHITTDNPINQVEEKSGAKEDLLQNFRSVDGSSNGRISERWKPNIPNSASSQISTSELVIQGADNASQNIEVDQLSTTEIIDMLSAFSDISSDPCQKTELIEPEDRTNTYSLLRINDFLETLDLPARIKNRLAKKEIRVAGELIKNLDAFLQTKGLGQSSVQMLRSFLDNRSRNDLLIDTYEQLEALRCLSGNARYHFDAFGILSKCSSSLPSMQETKRSNTETQEATDRLLNDSIDVLDMPEKVARWFRRNNIRTVNALVSTSDEELLQLRGIGLTKVEIARAAAEKYLHESASCDSWLVAAESIRTVDPQAYENFLAAFSVDSITLLKKCSTVLQNSDLAIYTEAFLVSFLPQAAKAIDAADGDVSLARDAILHSITAAPRFFDSFKAALESQIKDAQAREQSERIACPIAVSDEKTLKDITSRIVQNIDGCQLDPTSNQIVFDHPSLQEWIKNLPERDSKVFFYYLQGCTLSECGKRVGDISRERVRQIVVKHLANRPLLQEDRFRYFYQTYAVKPEEFPTILGLDMRVGIYLKLTIDASDREGAPLSKALSDDKVSDATKKRIRAFLNIDFLFVDGERIHVDRRSIVLFLAKRLTSHSDATMNDLFEAYGRFIEEHSLSSTQFNHSNERAFAEWTKRNIKEILNVPKGHKEKSYLRYYDGESYDFTKLEALLNSNLFEDIECSAALLFKHPAALEIMQELDINDEYELHYIAKSFCKTSPKITFGRTPSITFGEGDRDRQILGLIQEAGPISTNSLAELYCERYGTTPETFKASYLSKFKIYKTHGFYACSLEEMSADQLETLSTLLTEDYQPLSLIKQRFKDRFPSSSSSLINGRNLKSVGYRPSHGILIRAELDEETVFRKLIDENTTFSSETPGFFVDVMKHPDFESALQTRINAFDVIEYEKNKYIHLDAVIEALDSRVTKATFKDYVTSVLDFANSNEPFSIFSLRNAGFSHPVEKLAAEVGFGDEFLESLIATAFVGGKIKRTSANNCVVFCKTPYSFSITNLLEFILSDLKKIEIEDLSAHLHDVYGIEYSSYLTRSAVRRSDLYYHEDLDIVFECIDEYSKMVQKVLAETVERESDGLA